MAGISEEKQRIAAEIESRQASFWKISDALWSYAELGLEEYQSSKLLADTLASAGFHVDRGVAGMPTAFVASWKYGTGEPVIGFLAEYDALPMLSQKAECPTKDPIVAGAPGHGCGHNIHGTSALAAAISLRYTMEKEKLKGTIRFFGTPAEENYAGKVWMARDGYYDGLDACLSHHPSSMNTASLRSSTAVNGVKFIYRGKTAHAAGNPEMGRSALS